MSETIKVRGLSELQRALSGFHNDVKKGLRASLAEAASAVRDDAQSLAATDIRNIGGRWQRMRIGVTSKVVYVAPASRRRNGSPRPNLAGLLMDRAMQPALDKNQAEVVAKVEALLDGVSRLRGF